MTVRALKARARGQASEWLAALWLIAKGYRIVGRNFRAKGGELDIVALTPGRWLGRPVLVVVEVRNRPDFDAAINSVDAVKEQRLRRAFSAFIGRNPRLAGLPRRFDLMIFGPNQWPTHVRAAM
jgi:putative endonuclease